MNVTIGYLTDIHLRKKVQGTSPVKARHCREMAGLLPRALARLAGESPDVIVCTGDVLDVADGPEADRDLESCRTLFDDCGIPCLVLPGNHDPLPDDFFQVFPVPEKTRVLNGCELISFHEDACVDGEQWSRRSDQSLQVMEDLLVSADGRAETALLFQHYLIYPDRSEGYPHNYRNDDDIRGIMERTDRRILSVSGHYHPGIPLTRENGVSYFVGRAFCEAPYTCYLIRVSPDDILIDELETK